MDSSHGPYGREFKSPRGTIFAGLVAPSVVKIKTAGHVDADTLRPVLPHVDEVLGEPSGPVEVFIDHSELDSFAFDLLGMSLRWARASRPYAQHYHVMMMPKVSKLSVLVFEFCLRFVEGCHIYQSLPAFEAELEQACAG